MGISRGAYRCSWRPIAWLVVVASLTALRATWSEARRRVQSDSLHSSADTFSFDDVAAACDGIPLELSVDDDAFRPSSEIRVYANGELLQEDATLRAGADICIITLVSPFGRLDPSVA